MVNNNNTKHTVTRSGLNLWVLLLFFSFAPAFTLTAVAQDNTAYSLDSNTNRCVALRQGQTCYKKITIKWNAPQRGNFCLHNLQNNAVLQCWQQQNANEIQINFESDRDVTYVLRQQESSTDLATLTISVSWVYEPKPESSGGWRLF